MAFPDSWNAIHRLVIMVEKLEKINTPLNGNSWGWTIRSAAEKEARSNAKKYVENFLLDRLKEVGTEISIRGFNATITIKYLVVKIEITYPKHNPEIAEGEFFFTLIYPDLVREVGWLHEYKRWPGQGLKQCIERLKILREWQKY